MFKSLYLTIGIIILDFKLKSVTSDFDEFCVATLETYQLENSVDTAKTKEAIFNSKKELLSHYNSSIYDALEIGVW